MVKWQLRSGRAPSGRRLSRNKKKKRVDRGFEFLETRIGNNSRRSKRTRGGNAKVRMLFGETASVADPVSKKSVRSKILSVQENAANPHYVRRNIITKGALIRTEAGLARVTSRPCQHGTINAVLVEKK